MNENRFFDNINQTNFNKLKKLTTFASFSMEQTLLFKILEREEELPKIKMFQSFIRSLSDGNPVNNLEDANNIIGNFMDKEEVRSNNEIYSLLKSIKEFISTSKYFRECFNNDYFKKLEIDAAHISFWTNGGLDILHQAAIVEKLVSKDDLKQLLINWGFKPYNYSSFSNVITQDEAKSFLVEKLLTSDGLEAFRYGFTIQQAESWLLPLLLEHPDHTAFSLKALLAVVLKRSLNGELLDASQLSIKELLDAITSRLESEPVTHHISIEF